MRGFTKTETTVPPTLTLTRNIKHSESHEYGENKILTSPILLH